MKGQNQRHNKLEPLLSLLGIDFLWTRPIHMALDLFYRVIIAGTTHLTHVAY